VKKAKKKVNRKQPRPADPECTIRPDSEDVRRLAEGTHGDPFSVLGRHRSGDAEVVRCLLPQTRQAWIDGGGQAMRRVGDTDLFEYRAAPGQLPADYRVIREADDGSRSEFEDPYSFWPQLEADAMNAFHAGQHFRADHLLGARRHASGGVEGTLFSVWAPNAGRVSVIGDFNDWDGRRHPMRQHAGPGIWELFIPRLTEGRYKYEIRNARSGDLLVKADPFAAWAEYRPGTASLICGPARHGWQDQDWQSRKAQSGWHDRPMSVYEVHLGSWRRNEDGSFMGYRRAAEELCAYVKHLGFSHVELLGYQTTGYFAPTSRFGSPDDFRYFVDHFHRNGIGVILDWVPAHFPRDGHALAAFDGEALYEYHEPLKAGHPDWGTLVFNYERQEVRSFLISNALYWLQEFHLDGLRVDAVASMLYLNFSRGEGQWEPNRYGGLGFGLKWNMGWMHDTLDYMAKEPVHRKYHQELLTFGPLYAFHENFMLPLSHDEVVHLKKSLFGRMPGDDWQKFANLRLLYAYQWTYPGKQLLFMGGEFAQPGEWNSGTALPWEHSHEPAPAGVARMLGDLNRMQQHHPALSEWDCDGRGFEWLSGEDRAQSVISFLRRGSQETLVVLLNFTPVPRPDYRIPIHPPGRYRLLFNSDAEVYGGSGHVVAEEAHSEDVPWLGRDASLVVVLPPLSCLVYRCEP
jgi:1,4-alpha-glucan branching enzyme